MQLTMESCVSDVMYLRKLGKLLPSQKGTALSILNKKIMFLGDLAKEADCKTDKDTIIDYMVHVENQRNMIIDYFEFPRFKM
ncbi:hypothetical protein SAMN04515674_1312 [Pseudarcicella hirudinis]|uniref:Uncharacterized protein n=1 Tax=Pseudarcicella hirudinis TaxID=1079859 RepID=A0A1I5Z4R4_9BACT|nr:hypothetical protein [Pseudarcicella hirudinis]SFQ51464.1 hypothetical protein SAMN04515674_1312 [Pseudarcicella hirudinis]